MCRRSGSRRVTSYASPNASATARLVLTPSVSGSAAIQVATASHTAASGGASGGHSMLACLRVVGWDEWVKR